jgi:hypothetical protein
LIEGANKLDNLLIVSVFQRKTLIPVYSTTQPKEESSSDETIKMKKQIISNIVKDNTIDKNHMQFSNRDSLWERNNFLDNYDIDDEAELEELGRQTDNLFTPVSYLAENFKRAR